MLLTVIDPTMTEDAVELGSGVGSGVDSELEIEKIDASEQAY
jgi:hypothetical protein